MDKKRHLEQKVNQLLGMFPLVAILGARQCGKSTFVQGLRPHWKYYDLESPDHYQLISSDPVAFFCRQRWRFDYRRGSTISGDFRVLRGVIDRDRKRKAFYSYRVQLSRYRKWDYRKLGRQDRDY